MKAFTRRRALRFVGTGAVASSVAVLAGCGEPQVVAETKIVTQAVEKIVTVTAPSGPMEGTILVDGSSTVGPITQAVAEEYQNLFSKVRVPVGISGSGGGFKKFCRLETDISGASRFIKESEQGLCGENEVEFIELPVAIDGIAVVVNPRNSVIGECVTIEELNKMWDPSSEGAITNWSQVRDGLPADDFVLYGPGADSGTYDYFTKVVNGEEGASRGDYTPSEDDNVLVQGVSGDLNALGFFGLAYYEQNIDLVKALKVDKGAGCIFPNTEDVLTGKYPLSRAIFIYVSTQAAERTEVQSFIEFYMKNAASLVGQIGYVPLPDEMYDMGLERFEQRKVGTLNSPDVDFKFSSSPAAILDAWKNGA